MKVDRTIIFLTSQVTNLPRFSSAEALIGKHEITLSLLAVVRRVLGSVCAAFQLLCLEVSKVYMGLFNCGI